MIKKSSYRAFASSLIILFSLNAQPVEIEDITTSVVVQKNSLKVGINESFKKSWLTGDFFALYESDINLEEMPYSIALLPFIYNIYPVIWVSGKNYSIECMDEDAYYSLEKVKKVLQRLYPQTPLTGNLIPKELVKNRPSVPLVDSTKSIAILYSSGLDSTACSFEHYDKKQLLISAHGHADLPVRKVRLWKNRQQKFIEYAQDYGHTNAFLKSNYTEFLNWEVIEKISPEITSWRVDTTEGVGIFGAAVPILFAKGYSTLLIGSSFTWHYPYPTAANPLVDDNLIVADTISLKHTHFDYTRFDKVKLIVDLVRTKNIKIPSMRVCDYKKSGENCCQFCAKCQTVMNSLIALGEDPVPYGFNITPEEVVQRTKEYFSEGQGYWTSWNFCDMQQKLKSLPKIPQSAQWLLQYNFMKKVSYYAAGTKTRVNWHNFRDLAPSTLTIPTEISTNFCDNAKRQRKQEIAKHTYDKLLIKLKKRSEKNRFREIKTEKNNLPVNVS
ncbi:hypothetical protein H0X06_04595 [Candidatus Dependentiae bacterium]|nr:hypothetical protein [Candidatus Dependentiae bacterium]